MASLPSKRPDGLRHTDIYFFLGLRVSLSNYADTISRTTYGLCHRH